jgi:23S rRNA (guanosine2251-2'-O)-methyltransferase
LSGPGGPGPGMSTAGPRTPRKQGTDAVVVGKRPVLEAIRAGSAREIIVDRASRSRPGLRELLRAARREGVPVSPVPRQEVDRLGGGSRHQGVAARLGRLQAELAETDLREMELAEDALVVVLDGVTDPQNFGACARTAEAAGVSALVVRRRRGAPVSRTALAASAGALAHLPVVRVVNLARVIELLKEAEFWVVGLDGRAERTILASPRPPGRLALVLGSEGTGLSRLVAERCDELLAIPMRGTVGSLNVSVAAGVALFAYALRGVGER